MQWISLFRVFLMNFLIWERREKNSFRLYALVHVFTRSRIRPWERSWSLQNTCDSYWESWWTFEIKFMTFWVVFGSFKIVEISQHAVFAASNLNITNWFAKWKYLSRAARKKARLKINGDFFRLFNSVKFIIQFVLHFQRRKFSQIVVSRIIILIIKKIEISCFKLRVCEIHRAT